MSVQQDHLPPLFQTCTVFPVFTFRLVVCCTVDYCCACSSTLRFTWNPPNPDSLTLTHSLSYSLAHSLAHSPLTHPLTALPQPPGITGKTGIKTEEVDANNFDLVYRINTKGVFHFCKVYSGLAACRRRCGWCVLHFCLRSCWRLDVHVLWLTLLNRPTNRPPFRWFLL